MSATHLGFLGDKKARCGSRSADKSPDPKKITCRACVRSFTGEASLAQLLTAAFIAWGDKTTLERGLDLARAQVPPRVLVLVAEELERYFADGGRGEGDTELLVMVERVARSA